LFANDLFYQKTFSRWVAPVYNGMNFSYDDGITWEFSQPIDFTKNGTVVKYSFYNDSIGFAISSLPAIFKTSDGGKTWFKQQTPSGFKSNTNLSDEYWAN